MEEIPLLKEIVIIFALSIVVILLCHKIKLPSIVGFLITGILAGPHGLGFVHASEDVETLANIGIVLLLFTVGMEFSFKKILEYKRYFLIGGFFQVFLTILTGFGVGYLLGRPLGECLFLGFLLSLSSTAIVLRLLDERSETDTPQGRFVIGVMIFQDIVAIPMLLLTPVLSESAASFEGDFVWNLLKGLIILAVVLVCAQRFVPQLLYYITRTRSRELFLLSVLTICFSVAWLTSSFGLSLSLGAFLAGLIVSDSEYRHEAIGDILPFQDIFTSFFFVSIGMLLNTGFVLEQPLTVISIAFGIIALKAVMAGTTTLILGMPLRTAVLGGVALAQVGEFSFVIAKGGVESGIGSDYHYQLFLAVSLLTMAATPSMFSIGPWLANVFNRLPFPAKLKLGLQTSENKTKQTLKDHVIIVGFGPCGQYLARSIKAAGIPYAILEMNPDTVKTQRAAGEPIYFGDAAHLPVLHHVSLDNAKAVAILINDFFATQLIVEQIRKLNPNVYILARTRYMQQVNSLYHSGADYAIPDEFGSAIEIFTNVLRTCEVGNEKIDKIVDEIRQERYDAVQSYQKDRMPLHAMHLRVEEAVAEAVKAD